MKRWFSAALLLLLATFVAGCASQEDGGGSHRALGKLPAAYQGELPCADCAGIRYHLALFEDNLYTLETSYLGTGELRRFHEQGRWSLNAQGDKLRLDGNADGPSQWQVVDSRTLELLDRQGQPAASGLSYQLQRIEPFLTEPLEDRYWKLTELRGEPVAVEEDQREAHLVLHSEDQRVSGATGCNRLMGSFERTEESLKLGQMGSTMMACGGDSMALERRFLEALSDVASYRVLVNRLELYDDRGELLARFEVRHLT
ncbi:MAG TPA: META domain-containing protein [Halomonas sp.]|nr:META domain-containing protein [Halomonas sp.]